MMVRAEEMSLMKCTICSREEREFIFASGYPDEEAEKHGVNAIGEIVEAICVNCGRRISGFYQLYEKIKRELAVGRE